MYGMKPQRGKTPKKPAVPRKPKQLDPVEVYGRVRPITEDVPVCVKVLSPTTIQLTPPESSNAVRNGVVKESQYSFKHVFDEYSNQKSVFDQMARPCVEDVLKGRNALLFAYGITSSGKTYTMTGVPQDQGILPRSLDIIFNSIDNLQAKKYVFKPDKMNGYDVQTEADSMMERQRRDILPTLHPQTPKATRDNRFDYDQGARIRDTTKIEDIEEDNNYAVFVSYVEIYNNYVYDLLEELQYDPITGYKQPTSKILREDANRNMYVSGAKEVEVKSTEEAYEVLTKGQKRRKVANTALNSESSRSHSVFSIRLVQAPLDPLGEEVLQDKDKIIVSQLSLVDLAGSERTKRTQNQGDRLKEAGSINQSLMALRTCIETLRENQKTGGNKMVPYRDSRLTHLFKNHFDGEGRVRMIVCINPKSVEYDETIHVMAFAELTQEVAVARPTQAVRFDGLAKGRRRLNREYKAAVNKALEQGDDPVDIPIPEPMVYSMGDMFPLLKMTHCDERHIIHTLMDFLKERQRRREVLLEDYKHKQESFRENLLTMERENKELKARVQELQSLVDGQTSGTDKMQKRIRSLEKANDVLTRTTSAYEHEKRQLVKEVNSMRKCQMETGATVTAQRSKMRQIKHILGPNSDSDTQNMPPPTTPRTRTKTSTHTFITPAISEPDLSQRQTGHETSYSLRGAHKRAMTAYTNSVNQAVQPTRPRKQSPPPTMPKPRYHRRSRSAHEVWVDHQPAHVPATDTLMQPKMRKKRSVTNLTEKDTKKATNYALTTRGLDSDGDVATKIVKGDIMRTSGGGTAVVFTDVETLKQRSPGSRKRRSPNLQPEDFDGEWTDPEDRCRIAVEGHGKMKKIKTSQV